MKKFALILMAAAAIFAACTEEGAKTDGGTLTADFTISANPCLVGDEITFEATVSGGIAP